MLIYQTPRRERDLADWHLVRVSKYSRLPWVEQQAKKLVEQALVLYRIEPGSRRPLPLFQTPYLFAAWPTLDAEAWLALRWLPGVSGIIGSYPPACLTEKDVDKWRLLANDEGVVDYDRALDLGLKENDIVSFTFGEFEGMLGRFVKLEGRAAAVEISLLGTLTIVYVPVTRVFLEEKAPGDRLRRDPGNGRSFPKPKSRRKQKRLSLQTSRLSYM